MKKQKYITKPVNSSIPDVQGHIIYSVFSELEQTEFGSMEKIISEELVSILSIKEVKGKYSDQPGYAIVRKKMPCNTIDEILDFLPRGSLKTDIKSLMQDCVLDEMERLYEKANLSFDVEAYLKNLGLQVGSKEIYSGMEDLFLNELSRRCPDYKFLIEEYQQKNSSKKLELQGSSTEE